MGLLRLTTMGLLRLTTGLLRAMTRLLRAATGFLLLGLARRAPQAAAEDSLEKHLGVCV